MRDALTSLPWVKEAKVDYATKQAVVKVDAAQYESEKLIAALKRDGYDGKVNAAR